MPLPTDVFVQDVVDDMRDNGLQLKAEFLTAIGDINTAWDNMLTALQAINYTPGTAGINFTYSAPTIPADLTNTTDFGSLTDPTEVAMLAPSTVDVAYDPTTSTVDLTFVAPGSPVEPDFSSDGPGAVTIGGITYVADTSGISFTYTAPSAPTITDYSGAGPSAVTVPTADAVAIGNVAWNAIALRTEGLRARTGVQREWEASNMAAANGHAQLSETQAANLRGAQDDTDIQTSENIRVSFVEQEKAEREDIKDLTRLNIDNFIAQWNSVETYTGAGAIQLNALVGLMQAEIASQGQKLAFTAEDVRTILEKAQQTADTTIRAKGLDVDNYKAQWSAVQIYASAAAAMLNARVNSIQIQLQSEAERYKYADLEIRTILGKAAKRADLDMGEFDFKNRYVVTALDNYKAQVSLLSDKRQRFEAEIRRDVDVFTANLQKVDFELRSRAEERGWKEADVNRLLEEADKTTAYVLDRTRLIQEKAVDIAEKIATLMAGGMQAFLQAVDAQASARWGVDYNYNTTRSCECDEIVL